MKIIEKKDWSLWRHSFTCVKCESRLEAEPEDIARAPATGDQRDPTFERFYVCCPVCSNQETLVAEDVPRFLQENARSRSARWYSDR